MSSEPLVVAPIYIVVIASTVLSIMWGIIFKDMLEYQVAVWDANPEPQKTINYKTPQLRIAYLGMSFLVWVCVSASLAVFIQIYSIAVIMGTLVVIPTALLIWTQLGSMLNLMSVKGYEAINIDAFFADTPPQQLSNTPTPKE